MLALPVCHYLNYKFLCLPSDENEWYLRQAWGACTVGQTSFSRFVRKMFDIQTGKSFARPCIYVSTWEPLCRATHRTHRLLPRPLPPTIFCDVIPRSPLGTSAPAMCLLYYLLWTMNTMVFICGLLNFVEYFATDWVVSILHHCWSNFCFFLFLGTKLSNFF